MITLTFSDRKIVLKTADELYLLYNDWVSMNDEVPDETLTEILEAIRNNYRVVWDNFHGTFSIEMFENEVERFLLKEGYID